MPNSENLLGRIISHTPFVRREQTSQTAAPKVDVKAQRSDLEREIIANVESIVRVFGIPETVFISIPLSDENELTAKVTNFVSVDATDAKFQLREVLDQWVDNNADAYTPDYIILRRKSDPRSNGITIARFYMDDDKIVWESDYGKSPSLETLRERSEFLNNLDRSFIREQIKKSNTLHIAPG